MLATHLFSLHICLNKLFSLLMANQFDCSFIKKNYSLQLFLKYVRNI